MRDDIALTEHRAKVWKAKEDLGAESEILLTLLHP